EGPIRSIAGSAWSSERAKVTDGIRHSVLSRRRPRPEACRPILARGARAHATRGAVGLQQRAHGRALLSVLRRLPLRLALLSPCPPARCAAVPPPAPRPSGTRGPTSRCPPSHPACGS